MLETDTSNQEQDGKYHLNLKKQILDVFENKMFQQDGTDSTCLEEIEQKIIDRYSNV